MALQVSRNDLRQVCVLSMGLLAGIFTANGQTEIGFVSDTQAPMWAETIVLKANHNEKATGKVFHDIIKTKPSTLFILGDVVNLSCKEKRWHNMDRYLDSCRQAGIPVSALLGNHDVMSNASKGESNFQRRFPDHNRTGYYKILDSTAFVLLNSNFKKLSQVDFEAQQQWYQSTLSSLDADPSVAVIIVACHHAPYSNSKIVGSSKPVQERFVPYFYSSAKACIFITGHSHNFERFTRDGKDFLVIGGGGGIHQPLNQKADRLDDVSGEYKPDYHYITLQRSGRNLIIVSRALAKDFSGFSDGYTLKISRP